MYYMYMYCIDHPHKSHSMAHASNSEVIYVISTHGSSKFYATWDLNLLCWIEEDKQTKRDTPKCFFEFSKTNV